MTCRQRFALYVRRYLAPLLQWIEATFDNAFGAPEHQQWRFDAPASGAVFSVVLKINAGPRTIVLTKRMDSAGPLHAAKVLGIGGIRSERQPSELHSLRRI